MRRLIVLALGVVLGACTGGGGGEAPLAAYRDRARPIYSTAVLTPQEIEGRFVQVGGFDPDGAACPAGGGMQLSGGRADFRLCLNGRVRRGAGDLRWAGPGRLTLPGLQAPVWILWVDDDRRTLVLGTPDGSFGAVLNRGGPLPADRARAAERILEWNGYRMAQFRLYGS